MADKKYPWEENLDWYKPSGAVQDAYAQYDSLIGQKPGEYQNAWGGQIGGLYDQITNRPAFNYDLNADALYNQYKDQYQRLGSRSMQDTIGQASALTGGYGSSYGATVGQQQYNQYMESLNNIVPELEQNAYGKYQQQGQDLYNLYGMALNREATDYGRYQDSMSNWMNQQNAAYGRYMDQMGFDYGQQQDLRNYDFQQEQFGYGKEQDALAQQNWLKQFGYGKEQDALAQQNWQQQFDYGKEQDALAQQNWQQQFGYGQEQDALAQQNWQTQFQYGKEYDAAQQAFQNAQFEYGKAMDAQNFQSAEYWKNQQGEYQKQMDEQAQANWEKQFGYGVETDEKQQNFQLAMMLLQSGKMPNAAMLEKAGIDAETAKMLQQQMTPMTGGSTGGTSGRGPPILKN